MEPTRIVSATLKEKRTHAGNLQRKLHATTIEDHSFREQTFRLHVDSKMNRYKTIDLSIVSVPHEGPATLALH